MLIKDCYHRFGQQCLDDYLNSDSPRNNTCPQCRREWYTRQAAWMATRDISTTESLIAFSLPREPVRFERRARTHRTQRTWTYDRATNNSLINSHMDEIFRRLDLIQNISDEQHTSSADTRVRLQAVERRARRLYQELQRAYEDNSAYQAPSSAGVRTQEPTRDLGTSGQDSRLGRRRLMETNSLELDHNPYSPMSIANHNTDAVPRATPTLEQISARINTSSDSTFDIHRESPSPPPEDPISPGHYAEYLRWGGDMISNDDLPRLRESSESSANGSGFARVLGARDRQHTSDHRFTEEDVTTTTTRIHTSNVTP